MTSPGTVLLVHNRYRQRGGEDGVYEAEGRLLEAHGHRVLRYERHNDELGERPGPGGALNAVWNQAVYRDVAALVARERPAVVHVHNTQPIISNAVLHAAHAGGAAVVQTLHNYRLLCPGGMLLRDGAACEACVGRLPWRAVVHGCYRQDRAASAVVAATLVAHRALGTWTRRVDALVALSEFARGRFLAGGLPAGRLHVKPGFLEADPGPGGHEGGDVLFVGRLSPEKGVDTLLAAWRMLPGDGRLSIVGEGPLADLVRNEVSADPRITWLGPLPREQVLERMRRARALVFPSLCYENFPLVLAEAAATGLPVLASDLGSMRELVLEGVTGARFPAGDARALAERLQSWQAANLRPLGEAARARYLREWTSQAGYARLLEIYRAALARRGELQGPRPADSFEPYDGARDAARGTLLGAGPGRPGAGPRPPPPAGPPGSAAVRRRIHSGLARQLRGPGELHAAGPAD